MMMAKFETKDSRSRVLKKTTMMRRSTHCFKVWDARFEVDTKYMFVGGRGRGAYGVVCSSFNSETREKVAIKKVTNVFKSNGEAIRALRELMILRKLRHENVIALKDVMLGSQSRTRFKDVYMVYELMDSDLNQIIKSPQPLSNNHCRFLLYQLLRGLKYLHSANILHRDLKPANLLVNANCELKIADFGLANTNTKVEGQSMTDYVVTRWYRAPELLLGCGDYGTSIDVWSVGCILAELLGRKPIFPGTDPLNQLKLILSVLGTPKDSDIDFLDDDSREKRFIKSLPYYRATRLSRLFPGADPQAIDLLSKLLTFDPIKRITVNEALEHRYFWGVYDPKPNLPARPIDLGVDDSYKVGELRELIWREMLYYHPEVAYFQ